MSVIISAFPGVGKSFVYKYAYSLPYGELICSDSDSSEFSWKTIEENGETKKVRNEEFPANYIKYIQRLDTALVLVSTHEEVRKALVEAEMPFILVYPERGLKEEYLERYRRRGSPQSFIDLFERDWDRFIDSCENEKTGTHIVLKAGKTLLDLIKDDILGGSAVVIPEEGKTINCSGKLSKWEEVK